jgi:tRNA pseudouridine38-40 synthase
MRTIALVTAYDGTDYAGFQWQSSGRTIQGELEDAWRRVTGESVRVNGAGRTDAGVHALGQVVSFRSESRIPVERIREALNGTLPESVSIRRCRIAEDGFHARFSAIGRRYCYLIRQDRERNVFLDRYSLRITGVLSPDRMRNAARHLIGVHDFRAFGQATGEGGTIRHVSRIRIAQRDRWLVVGITSNAFLRGMARRMVGELVRAGLGHIEPEALLERRKALDPGEVGPPAPPNGLFLASVRYPATDEAGNGLI